MAELAHCNVCGQTFSDAQHVCTFTYVNKVDELWKCPVSLETLIEPMEVCGNRHLVSRAMIDAMPRFGATCPVCRDRIRTRPAHFIVIQHLDALRVVCPQCTAEVARGNMSVHLKMCPERRYRCHRRCGVVMRPEEVDAHDSVCPKMLVPCPFSNCPGMYIRSDMETHTRECQSQENVCDECYKSYIRGKGHLACHHERRCLHALSNIDHIYNIEPRFFQALKAVCRTKADFRRALEVYLGSWSVLQDDFFFKAYFVCGCNGNLSTCRRVQRTISF
eukprot:m.250562 g.250562  ORF g.250562 m.250562 type:complete len:276 (+) comp16771_c0_seq1:385-1212(+)